ncbi:MAG: 4Fe-4S dicluster domain-containing protein [Ignavibacteria bacterium]|nr:MAG: 4Fe-4S dicluster domain-containing protein [Ignavibacteria bacterium]
MEVLLENLITYGLLIIIIGVTLFIYLRKHKKESKKTIQKIKKAKEFGFHEPVSLHPVIDYDSCIGSGACVEACPEQDILGLVNGKGATINASRCVGHGACFHACPVQAISLVMGTEKRGVDLPHVSQNYESNVPGIYIAGELGGMGLIKNAVEQGKLAVDYIAKSIKRSGRAEYDIIVIGAGPAGISATLNAKKHKLKHLTIEQETLGGTVYSFPRAKIVMTSPMDLPLYGKVKLVETKKDQLLEIWREVLEKNKITINEQERVVSVKKSADFITVETTKGKYTTETVLLAIGRRGTPRKLGVPGEDKPKVYYKLLEPELIHQQDILVVGGGDSAVESAMLLADEDNRVTLSYRSESFKRIKPKNLERINEYANKGKINILYSTNVKEIFDDKVILVDKENNEIELKNDLVYVFAGGILPNKFLEDMGITITKRFGEVIMKHK